MKYLNAFILIVCFLFCNLIVNAQDLSFKVTVTTTKTTEPMVAKVSVSGAKMVLQLMNMGTPSGMRVLVDNTQNKQYMLMDMNGQKMAMAMDMKTLDKATEATTQPKVTFTKEARTINGYKCTKVITETEGQKADVWVSPDVAMNYTDFYKILTSTKNQSSVAGIPELKNIKGFPIEIISTDLKTKETTTIKISDISSAKSDPKLFSMEGYTVMDAPKSTH